MDIRQRRWIVDRLICLAVAALAYGSLMPFGLDAADMQRLLPIQTVSTLHRPSLHDADFLANVLVFVPMGLLFRLRFRRVPTRPIIEIGSAVCCAVSLSVGLEWLQAGRPGRVADVNDIVANGLGAILGAVVGPTLWRSFESFVTHFAASSGIGTRLAGATLVVFSLAGADNLPSVLLFDIVVFSLLLAAGATGWMQIARGGLKPPNDDTPRSTAPWWTVWAYLSLGGILLFLAAAPFSLHRPNHGPVGYAWLPLHSDYPRLWLAWLIDGVPAFVRVVAAALLIHAANVRTHGCNHSGYTFTIVLGFYSLAQLLLFRSTGTRADSICFILVIAAMLLGHRAHTLIQAATRVSSIQRSVQQGSIVISHDPRASETSLRR